MGAFRFTLAPLLDVRTRTEEAAREALASAEHVAAAERASLHRLESELEQMGQLLTNCGQSHDHRSAFSGGAFPARRTQNREHERPMNDFAILGAASSGMQAQRAVMDIEARNVALAQTGDARHPAHGLVPDFGQPSGENNTAG